MLDGHEDMYGLGLEGGEGREGGGAPAKVPSVAVAHANGSSRSSSSGSSSNNVAQWMMMMEAGNTHAQAEGNGGEGGSNGKLTMGGRGGLGDVACSTGSSTSTSTSSCKKQPWTPEEDEHLRLLVQRHGPRDWSKIAERLYQRNGKQ